MYREHGYKLPLLTVPKIANGMWTESEYGEKFHVERVAGSKIGIRIIYH